MNAGEPVTITTFKGEVIALDDRDIERLNERLREGVRTMAGCLLWTGEIAEGGYGRMWLKGRNRRIHRVMYEVRVKSIPPGLVIDHLCRNRNCVNPDHMDVVTSAENTLRSPIIQQKMRDRKIPIRLSKGRGPAKLRQHCPKGHAYEGTNLITEKDGHRKCRACRQQFDRLRRSRRRA